MGKEYVVGFVFDEDFSHVLMIDRSKDPYQGLMNGIGGKVEPGEAPLTAMIREFNEEAFPLCGSIYKLLQIVDLHFPNTGTVLHCYAIQVSMSHSSVLSWVIKDEGEVIWLDRLHSPWLMDVTSPYLAGDGNIPWLLRESLALLTK